MSETRKRRRGNIVVMAACILFIMLSLATISIGVATRDGMNPFPSNGGSTQPVSAIPPSEDPFLIKTSTDITCSGSVTEQAVFVYGLSTLVYHHPARLRSRAVN